MPVEDTYEETADHALRGQLGLRPIAYRNDEHKGAHPDQRPCPSWCWIGQSNEYDHEILQAHPLAALHTTDGTVSMAASQYRGRRGSRPMDWIEMATLEARLEQLGQGEPVIRLALRAVGAGREGALDEDFDKDRLNLSVPDAEDLVVVLQHMIGLTRGGAS
jgi:hypothetical protein